MFSQFEKTTLTLDLARGADERDVWRYREFSLYFEPTQHQRWQIIYIPFGACFPFNFDSPEQAAIAAVELDKLRNDWGHISLYDLRMAHQDIHRVLTKNGGTELPALPGTCTHGNFRNGYAQQ